MNRKTIRILAFDIEEWFHLLDHPETSGEKQWEGFETRIHRNVDRLLELLETCDIKATFFCLGWIAKKHPDIIKLIASSGHEIASHSMRHQLIWTQTPKAFEQDLLDSIHIIEDLSGVRVRAYRAPGFSLTKDVTWAFDIIAKCGIEIDCSVFPTRHSHGGFPGFRQAEPTLIKTPGGAKLKEFPMSSFHIFGRNIIYSGGGYFRLFPYPVIKQMTGHSSYMMTYFHPRDFDANQPLIKGLSALRIFRSYYGLSGAYRKLQRLVTDFEFMGLEAADKTVDWSCAREFIVP